jgi:hypothetical protein
MPTTTINYSANTAITLDLSSLGTSSTFLAGVESGEIDNTTNKFIDALVNVKGIIGHASTAPTIGQQIVVYVWGADTSLGTTAIDVLDGTASAGGLVGLTVREVPLAACLNGIDDDGDGRIDYPTDPGCESPDDRDELDPEALPACANDEDDDADFAAALRELLIPQTTVLTLGLAQARRLVSLADEQVRADDLPAAACAPASPRTPCSSRAR